MKIALMCLILLAAVSSMADEDNKFVVCKLRGEVRTLEISQGGPDNGCETLYGKGSRTERVGWGKNFAGCNQILENVQKNLDVHGWKCNDKTENRVSVQ
jgi:hypothetical protein